MSIPSYYVIFSFVFSNACVFPEVHLEIVSDRFSVVLPFLIFSYLIQLLPLRNSV